MIETDEDRNRNLGDAAALVDAAGGVHRPANGAPRIVSLVPSLTELLFDLDLGDAVVGRTAFCVHPRDRLKRVRSVGGTKTIDLAKLEALDPTHVLVNIDETPRSLAEALAERGYEVVVTHPVTIDDNLTLFRLLGRLFGREDAAAALGEGFRAAREALAVAAGGWPWRRVLYLIWKAPWMTVGRTTYIAHMLEQARWRTVFDGAEPRYPTVALGDELLDQVDLVLFATEPFPFQPRHLDRFRALFPRHGGKAMLIEGDKVCWYGSRAIRGLHYLRTVGGDVVARLDAGTT